MSRWRLAALGSAIVASALLSTCGGGGSSPVTNTPVPPTTTLAPVPTPAPTPMPITFCALGDGPGNGVGCPCESPSFLSDVDKAIGQVIAEHPEYFDLDNQSGGGQYKVLSGGAYLVGVITNLQAAGFCAGFDGEEIQLKNSNAFNDQYHVLTSDNYIRRGLGSYRATCYPASFPKPSRPFPDNNGCSLPASLEISCSRDRSSYLADVDSAITELSQKHPEYFNLGDYSRGTDWFRVVSVDAYVKGMADALKSKGYCARWDGEELVAKKENRFSDHYDILTGENYVRRGEGSYRASCYPAAF